MKRNPDSSWNPASPCEISPTEFEQQVLAWLSKAAQEEGHCLNLSHQGVVSGSGGQYAIDVQIELSLAGARLIVLVECKHQARPVERDEVIVLEGKLRDVGGHKGMLFSTSGFQSGAISYASARGIATITVVDGDWVYETKAAGPKSGPPPWVHHDRFAGIRLTPSESGIRCHTIQSDYLDALTEWFAELR
jgi:restriction system protein